MPPELLDELTIRRYLLGDLAEEDRLGLESRLLEDGAAFDRVALIEEELIDQYVRGGLSAPERKTLENGFLSTRQGALLADLSRNLDRYAAARLSSRRQSDLPDRWMLRLSRAVTVPLYSLALALVVILLFIGGLGLYILQVQDRNLASVRAELQQELAREQARSEKLAEDLAREQQLREAREQELAALRGGTRNELPGDQAAGETQIATLFPGSTRGQGARNQIALSPSTVRVSLRLDLGQDTHEVYQISIYDGHSQQVLPDQFRATRLGRSNVVIVKLPVSRLAAGDYSIVLSGLGPNGQYEPAQTYSFKVVRK